MKSRNIHKTIASLAKSIQADLEALNRRKAALLAGIAAIDAEVLDYHNALREVLPHDCSQGGTRKIYQYDNIRDAIMAHLPTRAGEAITAEMLWHEMRKSKLTYALNSVNQTLSSHWAELHGRGARASWPKISGFGRPAHRYHNSSLA